ncbi:DUF1295 domain-containing protein [Catalinimonas niigatensis]|uniref:DUF1295 domain-containing protein n=1 Tax=Catalinimonas niigatensis TaxID=1397264 RepID=UPI0026658038|nr:DUF1295 domain-containing protein [Catalinimonas niigatensis]WPP51937.1 DUF1295 domain-containing protein [Catalinimonas niigatensis]
MDLYGQKGKSIPQKIVIIALELLLLRISYWILFENGGQDILSGLGMEEVAGLRERKIIVFTFSWIVFLRMSFMMLYLLKRKIPWEESLSVPMAFALYYIGFSLLVLPTDQPVDYVDYFGIALFLVGSFTNTFSEFQRHLWKQRAENNGKLYTKGLFRYSMHINFFGDLLWVSAYAIITRNYYSVAILLLLFCMFAFFNIPKLDHYLQSKYGQQFEKYRSKTKKFIPFIY